MKFKLEIDCDNAAFEDDPRQEISRMISELGDKLSYSFDLSMQSLEDGQSLRDRNGNTVGRAWAEL